jgi:hypothetical protein
VCNVVETWYTSSQEVENMERLYFVCPSCERKLAPVEAMNVATQVVRRMCLGCREVWQIKVAPVATAGDVRADSGEFTFLGRRESSRAA